MHAGVNIRGIIRYWSRPGQSVLPEVGIRQRQRPHSGQHLPQRRVCGRSIRLGERPGGNPATIELVMRADLMVRW